MPPRGARRSPRSAHQCSPGRDSWRSRKASIASTRRSASVRTRSYLLAGERLALFDTGVDGVIEPYVIAYMHAIGREAEEVRWVIVSHCDVDHFGGIADAPAAFPNAVTCAHRRRRPDRGLRRVPRSPGTRVPCRSRPRRDASRARMAAKRHAGGAAAATAGRRRAASTQPRLDHRRAARARTQPGAPRTVGSALAERRRVGRGALRRGAHRQRRAGVPADLSVRDAVPRAPSPPSASLRPSGCSPLITRPSGGDDARGFLDFERRLHVATRGRRAHGARRPGTHAARHPARGQRRWWRRGRLRAREGASAYPVVGHLEDLWQRGELRRHDTDPTTWELADANR